MNFHKLVFSLNYEFIEKLSKDPRESVPMFEHQLVMQQLKNALEENYKIKNQFVKVQTDIGSVTNMIDDRLFIKYSIDKCELESPFEYNLKFADKVSNADKSMYMNRSELPQIDTLARTLFGLFEKLADYFNNRLTSSNESIDLSVDYKDKVGYAFSQNKLDFGLQEAD
jgi:RNA processing factor Prp31